MKTLIAFLAVATMASPALGWPVMVTSLDTPSQDPLYIYWEADELGTVVFPPNELISASCTNTTYRPCPQNPDNPNIPNIEVAITNLTGKAWRDLVYVSDPETTLTNDDGLVNGELAFNIDSHGLNIPLIFESFVPANEVFEPNEIWHFVIQDYVNVMAPPLLASNMSSMGLVGSFSTGDVMSSGSIIAPEPAALALLVLGAAALIRRRR